MADLAGVLDSLSAETDYARGALDVLAVFGLVTLDAGRAEPAGMVAAMVIDSLRAHLTDGVSVGLHWDDLEAESPRGVDILRAFEHARVTRVNRPTPARVVEAAQSIIKMRRSETDLYLMQFDGHAGRYQPIGGKREPFDADAEAALRREIAEELQLAAPPGPDQITLEPVGEGWVETTLSATYGILTQYTFSFFRAGDIQFAIPLDEDTRWLTRAEIAAGRAEDGRAISPIYLQALGLDLLDNLPAGLEV
jgi:8-oxo-dGTP pyrophosphatase MutT (NUDIX family)